MTEPSPRPTDASRPCTLLELGGAFLRLGCVAFGGPVAHLGYLHDEFVLRRRWLDDAAFADLVALCQFLPGPASSQVVFALGLSRAGLVGAVLASACFTLPSAVLMVLLAYGFSSVFDPMQVRWLQGLKLAAAVVVAQAVWTMGRRLCPDRRRLSLALAAAAALLLAPGAVHQLAAIGLGALAGWALYRHELPDSVPDTRLVRGHVRAATTLAVWAVLLVLLPVLAASTGSHALGAFDGFYRAGSLVFGGGHAVLPLLRTEVVAPGGITDSAFLAGYGAAQALPGPLFTFAAYLGTLLHVGERAWLGGLLCLSAIFLPGLMLIGGALPFWQLLRGRGWAQAGLRGANAAVVGLLLAVLVHPVLTQAVRGPGDAAIFLLALALHCAARAPAWLLVPALAFTFQWLP